MVFTRRKTYRCQSAEENALALQTIGGDNPLTAFVRVATKEQLQQQWEQHWKL
eukprot:gene22986-31293_t